MAASVLGVVTLWIVFFVRSGAAPGYTVGGTGVMPVAVILPVAGALLVLVSRLSAPPDREYLERFFAAGPAAERSGG